MEQAPPRIRHGLRLASLCAGLLSLTSLLIGSANAAEVIRSENARYSYYPAYAFHTAYPSQVNPVLDTRWAPQGPIFYTYGSRFIPLNVVYPTAEKTVVPVEMVSIRVLSNPFK
uniref:Uncharacterized protein n=1 Tax=Magnetococcus massalia (strain MO-1) TaxID=451514 RepID=A0A1S7LJD6_MAGMO|nr:Conserved exported protein of unknown function [Candidatus Magnetococcus massalia]